MTTAFTKICRGNALTTAAVSVLLLAGSVTGAQAWHYGKAHTGTGVIGGAIVGGAIGGAVKGKKGILPGAIIGGVVGGVASSSARPAPPPPRYPVAPPPPAYDSGLVYNVQTSLTRLGYNPGPIDGVYGQKTADAISAYEYNNKMAVTGQPTQGLLYHMQQAGG
jgi:hypothetical protein